mmetsp:Transcript_6505/g.9747  ORF Transcript_6505/g.9747 Transcript_6505/m.9747 type:complete len:580 (-) Transcript_6505:202-1941(-)
MNIFILFVLFIAFTIGLNLGLHGIISLSSSNTLSIPRATESTTTSSQISENEVVSVPQTERKNKDKWAAEQQPSTTLHVLVSTQSLLSLDKLTTKLNDINARVSEKYSDSYANIQSLSDIPIVLLTCNRPEMLKTTLLSLLAVRGVRKRNILISQDGAMRDIKSIAEDQGLTVIQNTEGIRLRGGQIDGAERIALHYKFSLTSMFDRFPNAKAIIIIEDDLLFSPDFYEYFQSTSPILNEDNSVFAISAWNDNGFKHRVKDPYTLRRTGFFPGLGWLLTRKLYKDELEVQWPRTHWDHWLRSPEIHKNREIVYPEIPRSFHNGIKGTFMNLDTHNKYFRDIDYNTNLSISWHSHRNQFRTVQQQEYEDRIQELLRSCTHLQSAYELHNYKDEILCLWIDVDPDPPYGPPAFQPMAEFFGIWHEHKRGAHNGLHEFYYHSNYIIIVNIFRSEEQLEEAVTYAHLLPRKSYLLNPRFFDKSKLPPIDESNVMQASGPDISCDTTCRLAGKTCNEESLQQLNDCTVLKQNFACSSCEQSVGPDQPAYVTFNNHCLMNSDRRITSCKASHPDTIRLCACSDES